MKMRRALMAAFAFIPFISMRVLSEQLPSQPIYRPFAADQRGAVLTFDFQAVDEPHYTLNLQRFVDRSYTFALNLYFDGPDDRSRVQKLAGSGERDSRGKPIDRGLSIPLELKVSRLDSAGEVLVYDKEVVEEEFEGFTATFFSKIVGGVALPPGKYRVRVEALRDIPELSGTRIEFGVNRRTP